MFLPDSDGRYLTKARLVLADISLDPDESDDIHQPHAHNTDREGDNDDNHKPRAGRVSVDTTPLVKRVQVGVSPWFNVFSEHHSLKVTVDTGAQVNMVRQSVVRMIGGKIHKSHQQAFQADGKSPINVVGETVMIFSRGDLSFKFNALVCENIDDDLIAGIPFIKDNDIVLRAANDSITFKDGTCFCYSETGSNKNLVRRMQAHVLQSPKQSVIVWPGDYIEVCLPVTLCNEKVSK